MAAASNGRRMRAFMRWMKRHGIECSDALLISSENCDASSPPSTSVKTLCDLSISDVVATIPKLSCLTVRTSAASRLVDEAELGGALGLAVAIMYEKSLGPQSKWFEYLQILPPFEPIPLLWLPPEIDSLLLGTELHKTVKEDKGLIYQDWKECIEPLLDMSSINLNRDFFILDEYLAAKSLVASRSFQIDEYHGFGMVPLADLFNHKTAAEDVHFTSLDLSSESDTETESRKKSTDDGNDESTCPDFDAKTEDLSSSVVGDEPPFMEMIIVKDVKAGDEVFNTYGCLGNAALLHRYGFTEPDNPFDILNIDLDTVVEWSLSLFSCRHSRRRLSLWRKLEYSGCISRDSEYFEVSVDGEPQVELLLLLYIMLLTEGELLELDIALLRRKENSLSDFSKKDLLTPSVCRALSSLADARESLYGPSTLEDDMKALEGCCGKTNPKMFHSLTLRISERRIIEKLRLFSASRSGLSNIDETRKRRRVDRK